MAEFRGLIGPVLEVLRTIRNAVSLVDVKTNPGGGALVDVEHTGSPGEDVGPLPGVDYVAGHSVAGTGRSVASGYVDVVNPGISTPGQRRTYGRTAEGLIRCQIFQSSGGITRIDTYDTQGEPGGALGEIQTSIELHPNGNVVVESLAGDARMTIDPDGVAEFTNANGIISLQAAGHVLFANAGGSMFLNSSGDMTFLNSAGSRIRLVGTGGIEITGDVLITGNLDVQGDFENTGDAVVGDGGQVDLGGAGGPAVGRVGDGAGDPDFIQEGSSKVFAVD